MPLNQPKLSNMKICQRWNCELSVVSKEISCIQISHHSPPTIHHFQFGLTFMCPAPVLLLGFCPRRCGAHLCVLFTTQHLRRTILFHLRRKKNPGELFSTDLLPYGARHTTLATFFSILISFNLLPTLIHASRLTPHDSRLLTPDQNGRAK